MQKVGLRDDQHTQSEPNITVFGRLELEWCERKKLLPGWWLEAGAGVV